MGQLLAEGQGLVRVDFNHGHMHARGYQQFGQIIADAAAAQKHDVSDPEGILSQKAEIVGDGDNVPGDVHPVARMQDKVAVGDKHLSVALHRRVQHPGNAGMMHRQLLERIAHHHILLLGAEFHHLHLALGKGLDIAGEGEAQDAADFQGRGAFGVDGHVNAQLPLQ